MRLRLRDGVLLGSTPSEGRGSVVARRFPEAKVQLPVGLERRVNGSRPGAQYRWRRRVPLAPQQGGYGRRRLLKRRRGSVLNPAEWDVRSQLHIRINVWPPLSPARAQMEPRSLVLARRSRVQRSLPPGSVPRKEGAIVLPSMPLALSRSSRNSRSPIAGL
ncbi:hypothetical protein SMG44B_10511 [Stenotrophomonas maltophilia]